MANVDNNLLYMYRLSSLGMWCHTDIYLATWYQFMGWMTQESWFGYWHKQDSFINQTSSGDHPASYSRGTFSTRKNVDRARSWPLKSIYCQGKVCMWLTSPPPYAFMACIETTSLVFILPTQSHNQWDKHLIYFHQHFVLNILPMKLQYLRKISNQVTQFKKLWRERNKNVQDHTFTENDTKITLQMLSILSTSIHYQWPCYSRHACITSFSLLRPTFEPIWLHAEFTIDKVKLGQILIQEFQYPPANFYCIIPPYCIIMGS